MASAVFLKITTPDVAGESTDDKHPGEIELLSFGHGLTMAMGPRSTAGSATIQKASHQDISLMKYVDKSTPELQKGICLGTHYGQAVISINKTDGAGGMIPYLVYTLNDVVISSSQVSGDGQSLPIESVTLNYGKVKWEYAPTNQDGTASGTVPFTWDVEKNIKG